MERTNLEALRAKCKLICNTCYVDGDVLADVLLGKGIDPWEDAGPADESAGAVLTDAAITIVLGWVETSRSEGGISTSIDRDALEKNILFWCRRYGLDASEYLSESMTVVQDGSETY